MIDGTGYFKECVGALVEVSQKEGHNIDEVLLCVAHCWLDDLMEETDDVERVIKLFNNGAK